MNRKTAEAAVARVTEHSGCTLLRKNHIEAADPRIKRTFGPAAARLSLGNHPAPALVQQLRQLSEFRVRRAQQVTVDLKLIKASGI
ncbi:hypothetical protein EVAR_91223_1 [Eumeta japonica]|uniref:Uncharacterized protein n=1 Tax=Eumeta variegata TaxID=151549 RepID=A0A4C2A779_EUMVA|nr:hypothetical protein EVAR_91223_1 [Eumeta japonica]